MKLSVDFEFGLSQKSEILFSIYRILSVILICLQIRLIITQHNRCIFDFDLKSELYFNSYMCQIASLNGSIQGLENHLPGRSNLDVMIVEIDNLQLHQLPLQLGETFPNLEALYIFEGKLTSLSCDHLQNMPNLRVLSIQNNTEIEVLHSNVFEHTRELKRIILRNNNLDVISHKAFEGLTNLSLVRLNKNQCVDLTFEDEEIANLSSYLMEHCHGQNEMFCHHNPEENCSCHMRQYQFIESQDMSQISVLKKCENVNVKELKIESSYGKDKTVKPFPSFFLKHFEHLETFVMEKGNIKVLESDNLKPARMLKNLHLPGNMIEKLRSDVFQNAPKLENINFSNNQIKEIGVATFRHLNYLKLVILMGNQLSSQDLFPAAEIKRLDKVQIGKLVIVHDVLLCEFHHMSFTYSDYPYTCYVTNINQQNDYHNNKKTEAFYGMVGKHNDNRTAGDVRAIVIRDQKCNSLPKFLNPFFAQLKGLIIVNCSLRKLNDNNFESLGNLRHLNLSKNQIKHLNFKIFESMPELRFIDFSNNRLLTANFINFGSLKYLKKISFLDNQCINVMRVITKEHDLELIKTSLDNCSTIVLSCAYHDPNICKVTSSFDKKVQLRVRDVTVDNDSYQPKSFTSLVIENLKFTHFPNNLSEFMPNLETIIVKNTSFEDIGPEVLSNLKNLTTLKITNNKLSNLTAELFKDNLNIIYMDFTENDFRTINPETFKNLTNLKFLSLRSKGCFDSITEEGHLRSLKRNNVKQNCKAWSAEDNYKTHESKIDPLSTDYKIYTHLY